MRCFKTKLLYDGYLHFPMELAKDIKIQTTATEFGTTQKNLGAYTLTGFGTLHTCFVSGDKKRPCHLYDGGLTLPVLVGHCPGSQQPGSSVF